MKLASKPLLCGALAMMLAAPAALAKVSSEEAAKLGKELTPFGAIRAGNTEGTIPAWEGGITTPPAGYQPGMHHLDPFAGDAPIATITAANVDQFRDKLSPGQLAMFARYPETWKMNIYPTRRSASYPQRLYDFAIANATTAELAADGNGVLNARESIPFPIPQNGLHAIWNHLLRYRGQTVRRIVGQVSPTAGGDYNLVKIDESIYLSYAHEGETIESINNTLGYFLQEVTAPARLAGTILLVHETLNQAVEPRKAWTYNPGQRRVRRAPNVAYDNPGTASDGQRTSDQLDMFNGAPDRYNWELKGRREMYVPYNSYKLHSDAYEYDEIVQAGHLNQDLTRYELHRVWEVDATLKDGTSHIYARRTFYFDEDSWQIVAADQYDGRGEIWRISEAHNINYYDVPLLWETVLTQYDVQNGRYLAFGLNNQDRIEVFNEEMDPEKFTPQALRRKGRR